MDINMANIVSDIGGLIGSIIVALAVAFGSERTTELAKQLLRMIGSKSRFLNWVAPHGIGSWLLAIVPAFLLAFGFNINVLQDFELFANVDAELVKILSTLIIWGLSNVIHPEMPRPAVAKK